MADTTITMAVSTFDLFKIGIGPSSSHTVGPMRAACLFATRLRDAGLLGSVARLRCGLYGSLGATGKGHGTDKAVMLGLEGEQPDLINPDVIDERLARIREDKTLNLAGSHGIRFSVTDDLVFYRREALPFHPNGMTLDALDATGSTVLSGTFYSVGGGFVVEKDEEGSASLVPDRRPLPYPFSSGAGLLQLCTTHGKSIAQIMWANEEAWNPPAAIREKLLHIWRVM